MQALRKAKPQALWGAFASEPLQPFIKGGVSFVSFAVITHTERCLGCERCCDASAKNPTSVKLRLQIIEDEDLRLLQPPDLRTSVAPAPSRLADVVRLVLRKQPVRLLKLSLP